MIRRTEKCHRGNEALVQEPAHPQRSQMDPIDSTGGGRLLLEVKPSRLLSKLVAEKGEESQRSQKGCLGIGHRRGC